MAASVQTPLEEYLSTSYEVDCDYVDGEVLERNVGEHDHSRLQGLVIALFFPLEKQHSIRVFPEQRVRVASSPPRIRYRIPDICVMRHPYRKERVLIDPPLIVVEILSPEDRFRRTMDRLDDFHQFGVPHIWVLDPETRKMFRYVHEPGGAALREIEERSTMVPELGLEIDFKPLFEDLGRE
jgi:Uma2 family endonuclease